MTTRELIGAVTQGLGALVWWDLAETQISPAALKAVFVAEGEDPAQVPDLLDHESQMIAVKRAAREWRPSGPGMKGKHRIDVVDENAAGDTVVFGILQKRHVSASEVEWVQIERLTFGPGGWADVHGTAHAPVFMVVADEIRTHLDHQWIRPWVQKKLDDMGGCVLRSRGGVLYVPSQFMSELDRLGRVVEQIGASRLYVAHVEATEASRASIGSATRDALTERIADCKNRISEWTGRARKARSDATANMLEEFAELSSRARLYGEALGSAMEDLRDQIAEMEVEVKKIIEGSEEAEAAK